MSATTRRLALWALLFGWEWPGAACLPAARPAGRASAPALTGVALTGPFLTMGLAIGGSYAGRNNVETDLGVSLSRAPSDGQGRTPRA